MKISCKFQHSIVTSSKLNKLNHDIIVSTADVYQKREKDPRYLLGEHFMCFVIVNLIQSTSSRNQNKIDAT